jgi:ubiquinone/menaquinone biosynthesis C-methylase UbiE
MLDKIILQVRKPNGLLGRLMARGMNINHRKLTDWGLEFINKNDIKNILDIGCGGGRTIKKISILSPKSNVYGIDYSKESINISASVNKKNIKNGRVILKEANVSSMPFEDNYFDLIIAIESYFFWPDLENDMKEVLRVLKKNGIFLIVSGEYKNDKYDKRNKSFVEKLNMHYHSPEDLYNLLFNSGFKNIKIYEKYENGWLCEISEK